MRYVPRQTHHGRDQNSTTAMKKMILAISTEHRQCAKPQNACDQRDDQNVTTQLSMADPLFSTFCFDDQRDDEHRAFGRGNIQLRNKVPRRPARRAAKNVASLGKNGRLDVEIRPRGATG